MQGRFEGEDLVDRNIVEVAAVDREQRNAHLGHGQRRVLGLLHQFGHAATALELLLGGIVKIGGELGEGREFAVLRQGKTDTAAELLDDLGLGGAADARHRHTRVHGRRMPELKRSVSRKI